MLPDDDLVLGKITGLTPGAWTRTRPVLAGFFKIQDGVWRHGRVERERHRVSAKQESNSKRARSAAVKRWGDAPSIAQALPNDAKPHSHSQPQSEPELSETVGAEKKHAASRHMLFRSLLAAYWHCKNHACPDMPWDGRDAKALKDFLDASPTLSESQFRLMLGNRARSPVPHGDRVYLWIGNLTRFQQEMTIFNKPVSAGGASGSRAEINRDSVLDAVERAVALSEELAAGAGEAGVEPADFLDGGGAAVDGERPGGRALALPGTSDHGVAPGDAADGQTGTDGPVPYGAAAAITG